MTEQEKLYNRLLNKILNEAPEDDEEEEEETEETEEANPESKGSFDQSLDAELDAIFIDFETDARDAVVQEAKSLRVLYEEADIDEINIQDFASNVARLVKNYENLLDMEDILVSRAGEFLEDRYGPDAKVKLEDELSNTHDIEIQSPKSLKSDLDVPLALGASSSEG